MTTPEERNGKVIGFYDGLLAAKTGSEVLGFSTWESQRVRFEALCGIGDLAGRSILDVGCGRGDLFAFRVERGIAGPYLGVDIVPSLVDLARRTHPGAVFEVRDILTDPPAGPFDYVFCSGVFGLGANGEPEFVETMLRRMYSLARLGVAVNFVSVHPPRPRHPEGHYADPAEMAALAFRLTTNVVLRHDYKPNDFTLYLRHAPPGSPA